MLAANVPDNIGINHSFCSFSSFLIISLICFISNPDSSIDLTIFIISYISSFQIINSAICKAKSKGQTDP